MEDNMKILMTTDTVGGVWVYSLELCKALQKYGVQVHLAAMGQWPSEEQEKEAARLPNVLLYKSDYKLEWMQDPWDDVERARKWINSIYHTVLPDLVHLNNYAQVCGDAEPVVDLVPGMDSAVEVRFRTNHGRVTLNSLTDGSQLLFGDDDPIFIDSEWSEALSDEIEIDPEAAEEVDEESEPTCESPDNGDPVAEDDEGIFGTRRDRVRGVDRNSEDKAPKNLTKKLNRSRAKAPVNAPAKAKPASEGGEE